jgi:two-component system sensor histidine kinase UhpB
MTNAVRHARASRVELTLAHVDGRVRLEVADDGAGFDIAAARGAGGIRGMRERALLVGARLQIDSAPGAGTRVRLEVDADAEDGGR